MPKEHKKLIKNTPQSPSSDFDQYAGIGVLILLLVIIFGWIRKRKSLSRIPITSRFRRKSREATEKQMHYLANLVSEQNFFRSKPVSFEEWLQMKARYESVSIKFASDLIKTLKSENENLKEAFEIQKRGKGVGRYRGELFVSDIRSFAFCERAAYYSSHQYPSQNLVDLGHGQEVHQAYSASETRDSEKSARVAEFIKAHEAAVTKIEWLPNSTEANLRHSSLPINGRPDGFLHFHDGSKAVIELKTIAKLPAVARAGDFDQVDIYALLASSESKIRDESFVLYQERQTRELAFHKRKRVLTEYDLAQIVAKIERGVRFSGELSAASSAAQCSSCGYRSICSARI